MYTRRIQCYTIHIMIYVAEPQRPQQSAALSKRRQKAMFIKKLSNFIDGYIGQCLGNLVGG